MNYISFYRKWRPQNFEEIIGQDYNIKTIRNAISNNRLSHSYIFCGPRGTGKTSTARILAKSLNCEKGITPDPCNKCKNCISISNGSSVDVVEIDAASNRGINEIRELREKVKYLPSVLRRKVYIIDEVHMLTTEAFNALLKVLEEPPEHVLFIMATTEPNKVIPTILSRCQRFDFSPVPVDKIKERLQHIARSEKINMDKSAVDMIAKYADGSLRDADGILEQLASFGENKIDAKDIVSLLGVTDLDLLFKFTDVLINKNLTDGLLLTSKIIAGNQNLKVFVSGFLDHLYDLYVIKNYSSPFEIIDISADYKERYLNQAGKLQKEEIEFYMELFTDLLKQIKWSEDSRIFFKTAVIRAINFITLDKGDIDKKTAIIEARIESLKKEIDKINLSGKDTRHSYKNREEDKGESYGNEDDDFDIINTDEINRMVNEVEIHGKYKEGSRNIKKAGSKETISSSTGKGGNEKKDFVMVCSNLEKVFKVLKRKKISVYAMLIEASPDRIEDGILYFNLGRKKEWHRDHLNKKGNADLISYVIKETTGKDFKVRFEIKEKNDKGGERKNIENNKEDKIVSEEEMVSKKEDKKINVTVKDAINSGDNKGKIKNKPGKKGKDYDGDKENKSEDDVINYFEKKFNIKE